MYSPTVDGEPDWQRDEDTLFDASLAALERFRKDQPNTVVSAFGFRQWLAEHEFSFREGDADGPVFRYGRAFDDAIAKLHTLMTTTHPEPVSIE